MALPQLYDDELKITTSSLALQNNDNLLVGGYIASENYSNQKLFISCVNVDIESGENKCLLFIIKICRIYFTPLLL